MTMIRFLLMLLGIMLCLLPHFAGAAGNSPALVVVIVIDGLPQEQLVKYRDLYGPGGFRLLLEDGAWFANAHHGHAVTLTAPGHAAVLTGAIPIAMESSPTNGSTEIRSSRSIAPAIGRTIRSVRKPGSSMALRPPIGGSVPSATKGAMAAGDNRR